MQLSSSVVRNKTQLRKIDFAACALSVSRFCVRTKVAWEELVIHATNVAFMKKRQDESHEKLCWSFATRRARRKNGWKKMLWVDEAEHETETGTPFHITLEKRLSLWPTVVAACYCGDDFLRLQGLRRRQMKLNAERKWNSGMVSKHTRVWDWPKVRWKLGPFCSFKKHVQMRHTTQINPKLQAAFNFCETGFADLFGCYIPKFAESHRKH